jgi:hypothetical protein
VSFRRHLDPFRSNTIIGVKRSEIASVQFSRVIPEIKICRAANLMLKRYGTSEPSPARLAPTTL